MNLLDQVNASVVQDLFVENIDQNITSNEIRDKFDQAFNSNAGDRVAISCTRDIEPTRREMIVELKLNFQGEIESDTSMTDLLENGKLVSSGCPRGEVDRAGLN